jgi:potassium voltage-gated channel delayed-rectifier subfamily S protein 3
MTTVGYGDVTPVTGPGKMIASLCMLCGLIALSLPVTIIGSSFGDEYSAMQVRRFFKCV